MYGGSPTGHQDEPAQRVLVSMFIPPGGRLDVAIKVDHRVFGNLAVGQDMCEEPKDEVGTLVVKGGARLEITFGNPVDQGRPSAGAVSFHVRKDSRLGFPKPSQLFG
jgi:hypothetical protein